MYITLMLNLVKVVKQLYIVYVLLLGQVSLTWWTNDDLSSSIILPHDLNVLFKIRNQMDSHPLMTSMVYALCSRCLWNTQDALWSIFSLDPGARKTAVQIRGQFAMSGRGHGSWPVTRCVYSRQHNAHAPPGCLPLNYFSSGSCKWTARRKGLNIDSLCCKFVLE